MLKFFVPQIGLPEFSTLLLSSVAIVTINGCCLRKQPDPPANGANPLEWLLPTSQDAIQSPPKATLLLVHGVNNTSEVMRPLGLALRDAGYAVALATLEGHRQDQDWPQGDLALLWEKNTKSAVDEAQARYPDVPLIGVGYSLGSTLLLRYLSNETAPKLQQLVLIAPALFFTWRAKLLNLLLPLKYLGIPTPSMIPKPVRAHRFTTLRAYSAIGAVAEELLDPDKLAAINQIPVLTIYDEEDELVDANSLEKWCQQNELTNWRCIESDDVKHEAKGYRHLLVHPNWAGINRWNEVVRSILRQLSLTPDEKTPIGS